MGLIAASDRWWIEACRIGAGTHHCKLRLKKLAESPESGQSDSRLRQYPQVRTKLAVQHPARQCAARAVRENNQEITGSRVWVPADHLHLLTVERMEAVPDPLRITLLGSV